MEEAIQGPLLCTSGKLSEYPAAAVSCMVVCSRAEGAASHGGAAVLRNLESGSKGLNEEREVLQRA